MEPSVFVFDLLMALSTYRMNIDIKLLWLASLAASRTERRILWSRCNVNLKARLFLHAKFEGPEQPKVGFYLFQCGKICMQIWLRSIQIS